MPVSDERAEIIRSLGRVFTIAARDCIEQLLADRAERIAECKREKQAVIAKINEWNIPRDDGSLLYDELYESGWIDACDAILDFIRNPKEADGKMQKSKRKVKEAKMIVSDKEAKEYREYTTWEYLKQKRSLVRVQAALESCLDTREAVIAIGKEEKKLAEKADKEGRGDSVFRSGYLAGIDFVLDFIRNPKEADSSPLTTDSGEEEK